MKETPSLREEPVHKKAVSEQSGHNATLRGRGKLVRALCVAVVGFVVMGGIGFALWETPFINAGSAQSSGGPKQGRAATSQASDNQAASTNPFAAHARNAGVKTCLGTYTALGDALTAGARYMVQTETANAAPDQHSLQGMVGLNFQGNGDYSGVAAGLVFASPTNGACEGTMVRVVPFAQNCQTAANLLPQGSRQGRTLSGVATFDLPNGGHAMLLASGGNCVVLSVVRGAG